MIEISIKEEDGIIICKSHWSDLRLKTYWTKDLAFIKATTGGRFNNEYDLNNKSQWDYKKVKWHINKHKKELNKEFKTEEGKELFAKEEVFNRIQTGKFIVAKWGWHSYLEIEKLKETHSMIGDCRKSSIRWVPYSEEKEKLMNLYNQKLEELFNLSNIIFRKTTKGEENEFKK